jgi:hypothetical protein
VGAAEEPLPAGGVRCPRCGYGNTAARVLCQRCGFALRQQSSVSSPGPIPAPPARAARRGGWWLWVVLLVLAVALAVVVGRVVLGSH